MLETLKRRWFLYALLLALGAGITAHEALQPIADRMPLNWNVATVLFAMAVSLDSGALGAAIRRPTASGLAIVINLGLLPPMAWVAGLMVRPDLADGMAIAAAVPCTMGSAAVLTRRAGGNDTIALVVTMVTNLVCFVVTPAWIELLTGRTGGPDQDFLALVARLAWVVALPIVVGQSARRLAPVARLATRHRLALGVYAQLGILSMVTVGAVECGAQLAVLPESLGPLAGQLLLVMVLVAVLHTVAWAIGFVSGGLLGLEPPDRTAAAFAGSQKTLMIGLAIAVEFGGLTVLPMVAYHVEQLIIDTLLADWLRGLGRQDSPLPPPDQPLGPVEA